MISSPLAVMNRKGYLTINSQPAVNGEKSDHPLYGWGGPGGRVYQKAYVEFFASPDHLLHALRTLSQYPNLSVYFVNSAGETTVAGDCRSRPASTNGTTGKEAESSKNATVTSSIHNSKTINKAMGSMSDDGELLPEKKTVTALTWGVFPDKEVLQPTVFDPFTFLVWSKEAFDLWTRAWASIYDDESESSALLYDIYETYFLVAVIDNDYIDTNLFTVFDSIVESK